MPVVIYIFTLSAFALGLAEFVPVGLSGFIASGLGDKCCSDGQYCDRLCAGGIFFGPVTQRTDGRMAGQTDFTYRDAGIFNRLFADGAFTCVTADGYGALCRRGRTWIIYGGCCG